MIRKISVLTNYLHTNIDKKQIKGLFYDRNEVIKILENKDYELWNGDCLELMKSIPDKSIDMILCDLPYGNTACKWDSIISFDELWQHYNRIIKDEGVICLFGSEPFSSKLRLSNFEMYKYDWIWKKNKASNFINCKYQPLKSYENICVFSKMACTYSPKGNMKYFPQGIIVLDKPKKQRRTGKKQGEIYHSNPNVETVQTVSNYPNSIIEFNMEVKNIHPTQKPVDLLEYLIKTYTQDGEVILDNCMGSGSTGVAALNLHRKFIGMELDEKYFNIAKERIEKIA